MPTNKIEEINYVKEWNDNADRIRESKDRSVHKRYEIFGELYKKPNPEEELLIRQVNKNAKILDCGCGMGRLMRFFPNSFGIDVSKKMLELNPFKKRIRQVDMTKGLDFKDKSFDVIFLFRVLLHLRGKTIDRVLLKLSDLLKDGGYIYVDAPVKRDLGEWIWVLKRGYWRLTGQLTPVSAKCITMNGTKKILDRLGFSYDIFYVAGDKEKGFKASSKAIFRIKKKVNFL